ncbi:MAG: pyridoxal phosphate-dependent aminotransferase [Clostridiales bacterium]
MVSQKLQNNLNNSSWIRAMFEEGEKLVNQFGEENVFDYSLGNPDYEPPYQVLESLKKHATNGKNIHQYMNNAGYIDVRKQVANKISKEFKNNVPNKNIVMTCGAAGGLNVVLKTILNDSDEVIVFSPYFAEYKFYIDNHNGKFVSVSTDSNTFEPDLKELSKKITSRSKAIIINSPNNPTGIVYSEEILKNLSKVISKKELELGIKILVISDEPYTKLLYDNIKIPHIFSYFNNSVIINSYSKSMALAGERIGYIAVHPKLENLELFMSGLIFANRILGFVNAPSLFQKVIADSLDISIDMKEYQKRRDFLYNNLIELGFNCIKPQGAFYLFPKTPIDDDISFAKHATKYNLLLVPGTGFGCPGYVRIAFCINFSKIKKSIHSFRKLAFDFDMVPSNLRQSSY